MKRKRGAWKRAVSVLAICGLIAAQMFSGKIAVSYAEEPDEQQKTEQEAEKPSEEVAKDDALDQEQVLEPVAAPDQDSKKESEEDLKAKVQNKMVKTKVADEKAIDEDPIPEKTPRLVYGNKDLPDEDAFVLLIFGDGFTKDEQDKFFEEAEKTADYVMATSPWNEFKDTVKMYALGVVSNESGAKADKAINQEQADKDTRDTYFGSSFWTGGMQRLLAISNEGAKRAKELTKQYLPAADFNVVIVNAETYGGSGGDTCVASLNSESLEMMLHELGHTTANLADEYFAGASYAREYANMTAESDPEKVRWKRFIGKNGVGVYEYDNGGNG